MVLIKTLTGRRLLEEVVLVKLLTGRRLLQEAVSVKKSKKLRKKYWFRSKMPAVPGRVQSKSEKAEGTSGY